MENLKDIIAKLKAQQNTQQTSKTAPKGQETAPEQEIEGELEDGEDVEQDEDEMQESPNKVGKQEKVDPKILKIQEILEEIEMLQNDGRFRVELLHQMQEINQALVVIAGALATLSNGSK